jgi:hypothetical protein
MPDISWFDLPLYLVFGVVVADAAVAIRGDLSGFHRDLQGAEKGTLTLGQRLKSALSPKNIIGAAGALGIGLGLHQLIRMAGDASEAFSELQQTTRTVDEVFGSSADVIHAWGETAADAAGLSKREVNEAAAVMGQTLLNMGFSADEAAERVVQLQQRAADMALAFGKTPQQALEAITSAMRGERDTIEKFGVAIKQVDVNSRIAALGLDTSTDAAKKNSEAIAILDIIMDQSATSAGRFASAQDDIAVKLAQNQARIDNFNAEFGRFVADQQLAVITDIETFVGSVNDLTDNFTRHTEENYEKVRHLAEMLGLDFQTAWQLVGEASDDAGTSFADTVDHMLVSADEMAVGMEGSARSMTDSMSEAAGLVRIEAEEIANAIPQAILDNWEQIRQSGEDSVAAYNLGIFEAQDSLSNEIDALLKHLDERLTPGEEIARLRGQKMQLMLARGIQAELGDKGAVAAIDKVIADINRQLNSLNGYNAGRNLVQTLADGIWYEIDRGTASNAAWALAANVSGPVFIESEPKDHNSPLYGITKIGGNIVDTIAGGIFANLGTGSAAAMALAGALVPSVGMVGAGYGAGGVAASQTINYNLSVSGVPYEVHSAAEMVEQLMELGVMSEGRLT